MELDQRVRRLEDELKIIKNQVQITLLEIQEQVMSHYHPSLLAESSESNEQEVPGNEAEAIAAPQGQFGATNAPVKVKKVSLDEVGGWRQQQQPISPAALAIAPQADVGQGRGVLEFIKCLSKSARQIGPMRTRRILEVFRRKGCLPENMAVISEQLLPADGNVAEDLAKPVESIEVLYVLLELGKILGCEERIDPRESLALVEEYVGG